MSNMTLTVQQYTALVALARRGAPDAVELEQFLVSIEKANGITRYFALVRWQETDSPLQPTVRFPENWPPSRWRPRASAAIEKVNSPITRQDVNDLLSTRARRPVTVLVTRDPAGNVGWTPVDDFFR